MAQVKIYGVKKQLNAIKAQLSDVIHSCVMDALSYSANVKKILAHWDFPWQYSTR